MKCKTMRYHKIQSNSMQYHTMPCNTMESIKSNFWAKNGLLQPPWSLLSNMSNTKTLSFRCPLMGDMWSVRSGPSEPKKWGFHRCSVKKCRFSGQKWAPAAAPRPAVQRGQHKNVIFLVSSHDGNKKFGRFPKKMYFGPKNCIFGPKFCIFLRYTYETPIFWVRRTGPDWSHVPHILR